jgi:hypothetical protein
MHIMEAEIIEIYQSILEITGDDKMRSHSVADMIPLDEDRERAIYLGVC